MDYKVIKCIEFDDYDLVSIEVVDGDSSKIIDVELRAGDELSDKVAESLSFVESAPAGKELSAEELKVKFGGLVSEPAVEAEPVIDLPVQE